MTAITIKVGSKVTYFSDWTKRRIKVKVTKIDYNSKIIKTRELGVISGDSGLIVCRDSFKTILQQFKNLDVREIDGVDFNEITAIKVQTKDSYIKLMSKINTLLNGINDHVDGQMNVLGYYWKVCKESPTEIMFQGRYIPITLKSVKAINEAIRKQAEIDLFLERKLFILQVK